MEATTHAIVSKAIEPVRAIPSDRKRPAALFDLDGTLADCEHRRIKAQREDGKMDWKIFFQGMEDDGCNEWCKIICNRMFDTALIILVTGRSEDHRRDTELWLAKHHILYDKLLMRKSGDFRPDTEVKAEIFDRDIADNYNVLFCVDDRASVVKMWREKGLTCLQCDEGNF
jgi:hypothetical protein